MKKKYIIAGVLIIIFSPSILAQDIIWIIGDSLSLNYNGQGYPPQLDNLINSNSSFYNLAMPGQTCDYVIKYEIPQINQGNYAVVLCGTNDIYHGENSSQVILDIEEIYLLLQNKNIAPIFMTISPNDIPETCDAILEVNSYLRNFSIKRNITLIDTYDSLTNGNECSIKKSLFQDYVHLNEKGNSLVANLIAERAFNKQISTKTGFFKKILSWLGF